MIIQVTSQALNQDGYPFRKGALTSLKKITDAGHQLVIEEAAESQQQLLEQEEIDYLSEAEETGLIVDFKDGELVILKEDKDGPLSSAASWQTIAEYVISEVRKASIQRTTGETDIRIDINLDGTGKSDINTGLNFFDHMLDQIARHGLIDLNLTCDGDLEVDEHHTIEDVAIALGEVISEALGSKKGIERYGFVLPMDETQATVALDLSGRPYLVFEGEFNREYVGDFPTEMAKHFFYSLAMNLKATIHVTFAGENDHHKIEACFKGLARALKAAVERNGRIKNLIPSSKGTL